MHIINENKQTITKLVQTDDERITNCKNHISVILSPLLNDNPAIHTSHLAFYFNKIFLTERFFNGTSYYTNGTLMRHLVLANKKGVFNSRLVEYDHI
jgi:hypothetical protein